MTTSTVAELLSDKARQSTRKGIYSVSPETAVREAVAEMARHAVSSMLVLDGEQMVGLITLKELLHGLNTLGDKLLDSRADAIMKANPPVARPEDTVDHLRGLMTELHITHVPVMNGTALAGIL
ncbi:MAG TPA: CBS domain-containing protein, partial [Usitatibacteraceae bacterium]|nr:CBS domain-containing protein [Usitatibacteraceae bacterium]